MEFWGFFRLAPPFDLKIIYLEISANFDDINLSKIDPKFKTLAPRKWISNFVLDDVLLGMIQISKLEQNILYLGHYHYGLLNSCDYGPILEFLSNSNVVSRDLIVVLMSTNVSANSADHWLLGVISLKLKTVVIFDSLGITKNSHISFF
jgi:Ulp1 family protease